MQIIQDLVDPQDVKIIASIPLSKFLIEDKEGWHFTNNGRYSVKSGYDVERIYPDGHNKMVLIGPTTDELKAYCWKVDCPPKMKHFLWQVVTGSIAVRRNLATRGIRGDGVCDICGAVEETVNHVFFECPPARQVWALSKIPSNPTIFPIEAIFTNLDYLFWRLRPNKEDYCFAWILWYIWKARNMKVFSNLDIDPRDTLNLAETESIIWRDAQLENRRETPAPTHDIVMPRLGRWCFLDGSWKQGDLFSGQGWYSTLEGFDGLMGARKVRASISPLHSEVEALIWAMECMRNLRQSRVTFATDCSQLVKMVSAPEEWPAFAIYLHDIRRLQECFHSAEILLVPRTQNTKADGLAKGVRNQQSFGVHMDAVHRVWFTESI